MADEYEYPELDPDKGPTRVYEEDLNKNYRWAFNEGGLHSENESRVHKAMRKIAQRLDDLNIAYAVVGGMALFHHGFRRLTEDVYLLVVTAADIVRIHERLEGMGYLPPFANSKYLRDTEFGVRIEFLIAGEFPGGGKPKPVAFPSPPDVSEVEDGVHFINLKSIIELKLASGMTPHHRLRDLADVQDLVKYSKLDASFADSLDTFVRDKFTELWAYAQGDLAEHDMAEMPETR